MCHCIRDIFEAALPVELLSWRPVESIRQQLGQSFSTLSNGSSFTSLVSAPVSTSVTPVPADDREHSIEPHKQAPSSPEPPQSPKDGSPMPPTLDEVEHETRTASPTNQNIDEQVEAPHITVTEENDGFVRVGEDARQQEETTEQSKDDQRTVEARPDEEEEQLSLGNGGQRADEELRTPSPPPLTADKLNLESPPSSSTSKHKSKTALTPTDTAKDKQKKSGGGLFRSRRDKSSKKDKSINEKKKDKKEKKKGSKKGEKLTKEVVDDNHSEMSFGLIENDMTQAQPRTQKPSS